MAKPITISFEACDDVQIQLAAKHCGLDGWASPSYLNAITASTLSVQQRRLLIGGLRRLNKNRIELTYGDNNSLTVKGL